MNKFYITSLLLAFFIIIPIASANTDYQLVPNKTDSYTPPTVYIRPDPKLQAQCTDCTFTTYRLVEQLNCGATVAIQDPGEKPTCSLVPRVTRQGAIELTWDTAQTNVAFIDKGIGHVLPGYGSRIITPTVTTEYNMTVINRGGLVNNCSARVEITPVDSDLAGLNPIDPTELNIIIQDNTVTTQSSNWLERFIRAWWWLIGLVLAVMYFVYNKIKNSLGI